MREIILKKRYPHSREEDITDAFMRGYEKGKADRPQGGVDAIDRNALIDYCLKLIDVERKQGSDVMNYGQERVNQTEAIIDYIEYMPHVYADRLQGEWIYGEHDVGMCDGYRCDRCGLFVPWDYEHKSIDFINDYHFCPNCGADMHNCSEKPNNCEPQTYVINPQEPTNDEKCFECDDFFTCGGQCNKIEDEPHAEIPEYAKWKEPFEKMTDCPWK